MGKNILLGEIHFFILEFDPSFQIVYFSLKIYDEVWATVK